MVLMCALAAGERPVLPPPTALALDLAEAVGATVHTFSLDPNSDLTPDEGMALSDAVHKTGLFEWVNSAAQARLRVKRVDVNVLLVTVLAPDNRRLWVGRVTWPQATRPTEPPANARALTDQATTSEDVYKRVIIYQRQRLDVRPVSRELWAPPLLTSGDSAFYLDRRPGWGMGYTTLSPMPPTSLGGGWTIVRGGIEPLTDLEFAHYIEDEPLHRSIEAARFWPQLWWGVGFGAVGLSSLGVGTYLTSFAQADDFYAHRNNTAIGVSLITLGVASSVIALLFPTLADDHYLSTGDAQNRCDAHNAQLRQQLNLNPDDLVRFNGP